MRLLIFGMEQNPQSSAAKGSSDRIFPQEKSNLADVGLGIRMRVLL
jgi:hypothetical protein